MSFRPDRSSSQLGVADQMAVHPLTSPLVKSWPALKPTQALIRAEKSRAQAVPRLVLTEPNNQQKQLQTSRCVFHYYYNMITSILVRFYLELFFFKAMLILQPFIWNLSSLNLNYLRTIFTYVKHLKASEPELLHYYIAPHLSRWSL